MRVGLYCVYDTKIGSYSMPYFCQSDQAAVRLFGDALRSGAGTMMEKHPEDFILFRLADVDEQNGTLGLPPAPVEVAFGRQLAQEFSKEKR